MRLSNHCTRPSQSIYTCHVFKYVHPMQLGAELNRQIVFCRAFVRAVCIYVYIMNSGPKSLGACFPFSFVASTGFPFSLPPPSNLLYPAVLVFSVYNVYVYIATFGGLLHGIGPSRNCLLGSGAELAAGFFLEEFVNPRSPKWSMA